MSDLQNIWKNTLEDIKNKINLPTYKAWFEHITPLSLKKNCLTVSVGSSFAKEWLESRYLNLLSESIKKVTNNSYKIKIITVAPDNKNTDYTYEEYSDENPTNNSLVNSKNRTSS